MNKFYFGMTVDDVALRGWSKPKNFRRLLKFFETEDIPATFFVVPVDEDTDKPFYTLSSEYVPAIREAAAQGKFYFAQHGLRHNRFELGVPPAMILDLPHETENKRFAEENRKMLELEHSVANCRSRLREGKKILEDALEIPIEGFRAPALQESPGMFAALKEESYPFDSSLCLQETGWDYLLGKTEAAPREITRARWDENMKKGNDLTLSLTCDYTWLLPQERYDITMELALHDLKSCIACDIPFITVCHVDPVFDGEGIRFLHELYELARKEAAASGKEIEFASLKTIGEKYCK